MTQTIPAFKGALVETPYNFLSGDFGKWIDQESRDLARSEFHANPFFHKEIRYNPKTCVVEGSHYCYIALLNPTFQRTGHEHLRPATLSDLELILRTKALPLRDHYEDPALVLQTEEEPNLYLASHLASQVRARAGKNPKTPLMIPLAGLDPENDSASPYGLAFKLRENAELIEAPILNQPGGFTSADVDPATGLPRTTREEGDRMLYAIPNGLSGLCLGWGLDLGSGRGDLAGSVGYGRVVVVDTKKLEQLALR